MDKCMISYICRWSHDGSYFGRITPDTLSVYETPVSTEEENIRYPLTILSSKVKRGMILKFCYI